ncbi:hypothetical protein DPMN_054961 [Dreissena polymorpha]|uniref:Uncharacterized protein n=1 Tax=Dreissena polymorpha TaxID=45954 RepID=A0A9D4HTL0_DREPO|nr:hypothetical protein DPMN_054961 [Dreissena polymorpha]
MTEANNVAYFELVIDGKIVDDVFVDASHTAELRTSAEFWLLHLNAGSEVWIQTLAGNCIHGRCHTMFSGYSCSKHNATLIVISCLKVYNLNWAFENKSYCSCSKESIYQ